MGGIPEQCFLLEKASQIKDIAANSGESVRRPLNTDPYPVYYATLLPVNNLAAIAAGPTMATIPAPQPVPVRSLFSAADHLNFAYPNVVNFPNVGNITALSVGGTGVLANIFPGQNLRTNKAYIDFITRLDVLNAQGMRRLLRLTPAEIAQMASFLTVEETVTDPDDGTIVNVRSIFTGDNAGQRPNHQEFETVGIYRATGRRTGAGITNFSLTHEGVDSATRKMVKVDVSYIFQDVREMLDDNYARLFNQSGFIEFAGPAGTVDRFPRSIDFTLGWNTNGTLEQQLRQDGLDLNALRMTARTHMVSYTFNLNQDGSLSVNATYRGQILDGTSGPGSNILELAKQVFETFNQDTTAVETRALSTAQSAQIAFDQQLARSAVVSYFKLLLAQEAGRIGALRQGVRTGRFGRSANPFANFYVREADVLNAIQPLNAGNPVFAGLDQATVQTEITAMRQRFQQDLRRTQLNTGTSIGLIELGDFITQIDIIDKQYAAREQNLNTAALQAVKNSFAEQTRVANYQKFKALSLLAEQMVGGGDLHHYIIDKSRYPNSNDPIQQFKAELAINNVAAASTLINDLAPDFLVNQFQLRELFFNNQGVQGPRLNVSNINQMSGLRGSLFTTNPINGNPADNRNFNEDNWIFNSFIFLGHLIENVLRLPTGMDFTQTPPTPLATPNVHGLIRQRGPDIRIDLGLINFKKPLSGVDVEDFPLYYLPISHKLLNDFFAREIISKGRDFYPLHEFIMDLLKKVLPAGFNKCADVSGAQAFVPPKIQLSLGNREEVGRTNVYQYFIHGAKSVLQDLRLNNINAASFGNYNANTAARIPHFFFNGQSNGLDQEIKLIDVTDPSIKTAVYFRSRSSKQGELGNVSEKKTGFVPIVFQTEIKTIGFPLANIGQLVYIDLEPFISNPGDSRMLTAAGYYNIHKVTHTFSKDGFFTNLNGIIQLSTQNKDSLDEPPATAAGAQALQATGAPAVTGATTAAINNVNTQLQQSQARYNQLRQGLRLSRPGGQAVITQGNIFGYDFRTRHP